MDQADALVVTGQILASMNRLEEAICAYQQTIAFCDAADGASEVISARAGSALIVLSQHQTIEASALVEKILATQSEHPAGGVDQPGAVYLACYRVLDALNDSRATGVLERAHRQLLDYANGISDEALRRSYLENATAHRELLQLYSARIGHTRVGSALPSLDHGQP